MLEPEILKPYLLDDEPWVRGAVAQYFDEGWFQDEELVATIRIHAVAEKVLVMLRRKMMAVV